MDLNINIPAYFNQHYGIDEYVYRFCREVSTYFRDKEYSDTLHTIGIAPIAAPKELYNEGVWKESVRMISNNSCAMISIRMDFDSYYNADSEEKIILTKEMILKAVKKVKTKGKLDYDRFVKDFDDFDFIY